MFLGLFQISIDYFYCFVILKSLFYFKNIFIDSSLQTYIVFSTFLYFVNLDKIKPFMDNSVLCLNLYPEISILEIKILL